MSSAAPTNAFQNSLMNDPENVNHHKTENYLFSNNFNHKASEKKGDQNEERPFSSSNYEDYFSSYAKGQSNDDTDQNAFLKEKPKSSGAYMENYYESMVQPVKKDSFKKE